MSIRREESMAVPGAEVLERRPMSLRDYFALPEGVRAEWVDGVALMTPPMRRRHNRTVRRLANLIEAACPGLEVDAESGVRTQEHSYRIPDVSALAEVDDTTHTELTPVMVAEVLSPSTRTEDTLRKTEEYAAAGIDQYWIVDPDHVSLVVLANHGGGWTTVLELDDSHPRGEVALGDYGVVSVDLEELLG